MAQPTPLLDRLAAEDPQLLERLQQLAGQYPEELDHFCRDLETQSELAGVLRSLRWHWQNHMQKVLHTAEPPTLPPGLPPALREQLYTDLCRRAGVEPQYAVPPEQPRLAPPAAEPAPTVAPKPSRPAFYNRSPFNAAMLLVAFLCAWFTNARKVTYTIVNDGAFTIGPVVMRFAHWDERIRELAPGASHTVVMTAYFRSKGHGYDHLDEVQLVDARGERHWNHVDDFTHSGERKVLVRIDNEGRVKLVLQEDTPWPRSHRVAAWGAALTTLVFISGAVRSVRAPG